MTNELMHTLSLAGGYIAVGLAAIGSALGTNAGGCAAIGAWKKCYVQDKPAPFLLLAFAGAPLSQTIYGMIVMSIIKTNAAENASAWLLYLTVGVFSGLAMLFSAWYQGRAAAGACDAFAETDRGFANYLMILGIVETVAIFALVFAIMIMAK